MPACRHDSTKRTVCPRWLHNRCELGPACPLQHQRKAELMPVCMHFLKVSGGWGLLLTDVLLTVTAL